MAPSVIYIPRMASWWEVTTDTFKETFLALIHALPSSSPVLILATSEQSVEQLPDDLKVLFSAVSNPYLNLCISHTHTHVHTHINACFVRPVVYFLRPVVCIYCFVILDMGRSVHCALAWGPGETDVLL